MNSKKFPIIILCLLAAVGALAGTATRPVLKFRDGNFKIMQLTDLHLTDGEKHKAGNDSTYRMIEALIASERPDLAVMTGDIVWGTSDALSLWKEITSVFERTATPFAVTFGNHDEETNLNNAQILEFLETCPHNMTYDAEELTGSGNCDLPVIASDGSATRWVLYLFDSHSNRPNRTFGYYDWIRHDQIDWYRRASDRYTAANNGKPLPSIAFMHIPLWEYESARWSYPEVGNRQEGVCAANVNSGLFESFLEKRDVIAVMAGHDHNNDYFIDINGDMMLAFGRKTGFNPAYTEVLARGCRIISLREDERAIDTYIKDDEGCHFPYLFEQRNDGLNYGVINGTFGQSWMLNEWNDERWEQEMAMLRDAGMRYFIFGNALEIDDKGRATAAYPTKLAPRKRQFKALEKCLRAADKYGIRVFIGLGNDVKWWRFEYDTEWLQKAMEQSNQVADEIYSLYKKQYPDALYGWYWPYEIDNFNWRTPQQQELLSDALNVTLDHLTDSTPGMPLIFSPFANAAVGDNATQYGAFWKNIFAKSHFRIGDIFSPQDGIGAGGMTLEKMPEWMAEYRKAVNTKPGLKFWTNIEIFEKDGRSASPERVIRQLAIANSYSSNIISFAYTHHYSPFIKEKQHLDKAYRHYLRTGQLPDENK